MRNLSIIIGALLLVAFALGTPVAACGHGPYECSNEHPTGTCPAGETCGVTGNHYEWGTCQDCPKVWVDTSHWSDCENGNPHGSEVACDPPGPSTHGHKNWITSGYWQYSCHTGDPDYRTDSCSDHMEQHRTLVNDYGCIATTCPAIPCDEGYHCDEGVCVANPPATCPDIPCETGYHCVDHECIPDVCGTDFTCEEGTHCSNDNTCIAEDVQSSGTWTTPFTMTACGNFMAQSRPLDDVDPATLPMLNLTNTIVRMTAILPQGIYDCVGIAWYGNGETSYHMLGDSPAVEYFNLQQLKEALYGNYVVLDAKLPVKAIRIVAIKDELCDPSTIGHITLTDSHGKAGLDLYTKDNVDQIYALPADFEGWRPL